LSRLATTALFLLTPSLFFFYAFLLLFFVWFFFLLLLVFLVLRLLARLFMVFMITSVFVHLNIHVNQRFKARRVSLFAAIRKTCRVWPLRAAILTPERSLFSASVHVYARSRFPLRWASPRRTRGCVYMSCVDCYFLVRYRFEGPIRELYHGGRHD
jgi:hypothetical protein